MDFKAAGFFVPKSAFDISQIPDLTGKVAIVTGANSGIGLRTAKELLRKNARVYCACRSQAKAEEAIIAMKKETGKDDIHFLQLDLGDIKQCISAAQSFMKSENRLDILINSAGIFSESSTLESTNDGYESHFAINVIGHWIFTKGLYEVLIRTAREADGGIDGEVLGGVDGGEGEAKVRVVWVSSSAHYLLAPSKGIDFDVVRNPEKNGISVKAAYGMSKLGTIHIACLAADDLEKHGIVSVSLHPGNIGSDSDRTGTWLERLACTLLFSTPEQGALTSLYTATSPEITIKDSRGYFVPWGRRYKASHAKAMNLEAQQQTLRFCEEASRKALGSSQ